MLQSNNLVANVSNMHNCCILVIRPIPYIPSVYDVGKATEFKLVDLIQA